MLESKFYIYRHIRPDTNEVFYIGKGNNLDKRKSKYHRAYDFLKRSNFTLVRKADHRSRNRQHPKITSF
jgi:hypothetical protein